ncbi:MAG: hypothetical protein MZV63_18105 [Marinilabiliales bacterium]|nr:hypothetical protein [Marinilabiliales bacterium]
MNDYWASVLPLVTLPPALRATDLRRLARRADHARAARASSASSRTCRR